MNMRRRYYNSFFDHINEYKNSQNHSEPKDMNLLSDNIFRLGLVASFITVFTFGGYFKSFLPSESSVSYVPYQKVESKPAVNVFKADASFASEYVTEIMGEQVLASQDSYVDNKAPRVSYGEESYLITSGNADTVAFLQFDINDVQSRQEIMLYVFPTADASGSLRLATVTNNLWEEDLLTSESAPEYGTVVSTMPIEAGKPVIFDVTRIVGNRNAASFAVLSDEGTTVSLYSKEFSEYAPRLVFN